MAIDWSKIKADVRTAIKKRVVADYKNGVLTIPNLECQDERDCGTPCERALKYVTDADDSTLLWLFLRLGMDFDDFAPKDRERLYSLRVVADEERSLEDMQFGATPMWAMSGDISIQTADGARDIYESNKAFIEFDPASIIVEQYDELLNFDGGTRRVRVHSHALYGSYIDELVEEINDAYSRYKKGVLEKRLKKTGIDKCSPRD